MGARCCRGGLREVAARVFLVALLALLLCALPFAAACEALAEEAEGEAVAFAVYSGDDHSLTFYYGEAPSEGDTYNDKAVTSVYTGFEDASYSSGSSVPWNDVCDAVYSVSFDESFAAVQPTSTAYWFYNLYSCSSMDLTNLDTSRSTSMQAMFYGCAKLTAIEGIGGLDTSSVTSLYQTFYGCSSLEELDLSGWDTSSVTSLYQTFYECSSLEEIDISSWDVSCVTTLCETFYDCGSLERIDLSNWDVSNVTSLQGTFYCCYTLEEIDLSGWDVSNVTTTYAMFMICNEIATANLAGWDTSALTDTSFMFGCCFDLVAIYVGDEWTVRNVTSSTYMFYACYDLVGGNGTAFDSNNVGVAYACIDTDENPGYLTDVNVTSIALEAVCCFAGTELPTTTSVQDVFGETIEGAEATIAYYADEDCTQLVEGTPSEAGTYWALATFEGLGSYKASSAVAKVVVVPDPLSQADSIGELVSDEEWVFALTQDDVQDDGVYGSAGVLLSFTPLVWIDGESYFTLTSSLSDEEASSCSAEVVVFDAEGDQVGEVLDLETGIVYYELTAGETYYVYLGASLEGAVGDSVTLLATSNATEYEVTSGADQSVVAGEDNLAVTVEAQLSGLVELRVDGEVVSSSNYSLSQSKTTSTVTVGSYTHTTTTYYTIATLSTSYIATLAAGEHTLTLVYTDGLATTTFEAHVYEAVVTEPTCTEDGYTTYTCTACGDTYVADYVDALGHSYDEGVVTVEATCTEDGVLTYTCSVCGDSYEDDVEALGHDYVAVVTDPTCTEQGYTTYTCTACGDTYVADYVDALGHSYEAEVTVEATCTEEGATTYTCSVCGDSYEDDVEALGHDYVAVVTDPTSTEDGYTTYMCSVCGYSYIEEGEPATGEEEEDENGAGDTADGDAGSEGNDSSDDAAGSGTTYSFEDVQDEAKYYYVAIYAVADAGIMTGLGDGTTFGVGKSLNRQQMVVILYRIFGGGSYGSTTDSSAYAANETPLTDVEDYKYYTAAVNWAYATGVTTGYTSGDKAGMFGVGDACTFQQFCTFLARAICGGDAALEAAVTDAQAEAALAAFSDASSVSSYARKAVAYLCATEYAEGEHVVEGKADGTVAPGESVARQRAATVVYRCLEAGLLG